ncbi:TetR/AcrR family transcriptional regulator [Rhodococcus sp. NPDC058514]|uniref:TetR/AcrR family transcriptional regulator n=1 Tax=unclassified Rhodococcus (in: high G+C Gram-positive bacteria) TaxID=192944 RepID=UPI003661A637
MAKTPNTKQRLIDSFARQLASRGYEGTSLVEVAKENGITKPSLYHHFPDGKGALYLAAATDFISQRHTNLASALDASGRGLADRLERIVRAVADPTGAQVTFDQRIFDALPLVDETIRSEISREYVTKLLDPVEQVMRDAIAAGELAQDSSGFLTNAFLHLARGTDLAPDDEELPSKLVALFIKGAAR